MAELFSFIIAAKMALKLAFRPRFLSLPSSVGELHLNNGSNGLFEKKSPEN
jgi:hypothetical protein